MKALIEKDTEVALGGRSRMNLTEALAHSNNLISRLSDASWALRKCIIMRMNSGSAN